MSDRFVLDSSLALSWCFENELTMATQGVLNSLADTATALCPTLWVWEVSNSLRMAERAKRITQTKRLQQIAFLQQLPIEFDDAAHKRAWSETATLSAEQDLTVYDASYLELALRNGFPLGSLDTELRAAASRLGVLCLPEKI
jgi:predicted nucleic acid-binding protein